MQCPNCNTELKEGDKYCPSCGAEIPRTKKPRGAMFSGGSDVKNAFQAFEDAARKKEQPPEGSGEKTVSEKAGKVPPAEVPEEANKPDAPKKSSKKVPSDRHSGSINGPIAKITVDQDPNTIDTTTTAELPEGWYDKLMSGREEKKEEPKVEEQENTVREEETSAPDAEGKEGPVTISEEDAPKEEPSENEDTGGNAPAEKPPKTRGLKKERPKRRKKEKQTEKNRRSETDDNGLTREEAGYVAANRDGYYDPVIPIVEDQLPASPFLLLVKVALIAVVLVILILILINVL